MKTKLIQGALKNLNVGLSYRFRTSRPHFLIRPFSAGAGANEQDDVLESTEEFEERIFAGFTGNSSNDSPRQQYSIRRLDRAEKAQNNSDFGNFGGRFNLDNEILEIFDGLDERFNTLSDGMDDKLKEAATCNDAPEIIEEIDFKYRPDVHWSTIWETYELKDRDIRKPGVREPNKK